jgi:hypothetical protein
VLSVCLHEGGRYIRSRCICLDIGDLFNLIILVCFSSAVSVQAHFIVSFDECAYISSTE